MTYRHSLGIDLGTTNSAIALSETEGSQTEVIEITQILGPNQIGEKATLPSALYIPHPDEFPKGAFFLPWRPAEACEWIVGHFARDHGALGSGPPDYVGQVMAIESAHRPPTAGPAVEI